MNINQHQLNQCLNQHLIIIHNNHARILIFPHQNPVVIFLEQRFISFLCLSLAATNKPSFNVNIQGAPGSSNRVFNKGIKGSALLNRNDNANQIAVCYACGIKIR